MQVYGIIAEYNPFHTGHAHQIAAARADGAERVVVVMSGQFVQRGAPACADKWERAQAAVSSGADLVLELPASFAVASAERFAFGGVSLLQKLGCVTALHCGSECGDADALADLAAKLENLEISTYLKEGLSYPAARRKAVAEAYGEETARLLDTPNNILAISYASAIRRLDEPFALKTIPRIGGGHDKSPKNGYASAGWIRKTWEAKGLDAVAEYLPYREYTAFCPKNGLEQACLYRLATMSEPEFAALPDVNEGLEHRLYAAARAAKSLEEFYHAAQSKRYPQARIRRIVTTALLGIRANERPDDVKSARILACGEGGYDILRAAKQTGEIFCSGDSRLLANADPYESGLERRSTRVYELATKR